MADQETEASRRFVTRLSQRRSDAPGREMAAPRGRSRAPGPLDRVAPRIGSASLPLAHASLLRGAASTHAGHSFRQLQQQYGNRYVQRVVALARGTEEGAVMPDVERALESTRGGGQSLDRGVQAQMGSALSTDFSGVRVHADARADDLSRSLEARAFTVGQDIYFRQGEYDPGSSKGRELLAHELTHVTQQNPHKVHTAPDDEASHGGCACGAPAVPGPQMKLSVSQPGDQYEQEADRVATAIMHREQRGGAGSWTATSIHRQVPEEDEEVMQPKYRDDKLRRRLEED